MDTLPNRQPLIYTTIPGKLRRLLHEVHTAGVPQMADQKWLKQLGMTTAADKSLLSILRALDFVDQAGKPTDSWRAFRDADKYREVLNNAIRRAYSDLYEFKQHAEALSEEELANYFKANSDVGESALRFAVRTFQVLCEYDGTTTQRKSIARPDAGKKSSTRENQPSKVSRSPQWQYVPEERKRSTPNLSVALNVNITLPETTDQTVYESIFKALRSTIYAEEFSHES